METIYFYAMLLFNAVGFSWILSVLVKKQKVSDDLVVEKLLKTLDKETPVDVLGLFNPTLWGMYLEYLKNPESLNKAAAMMVNQTTTGYAAAEPTECTSIDTPGNWLLSRVDTNLYTDYKDTPKKGKGSWRSPYKFHK